MELCSLLPLGRKLNFDFLKCWWLYPVFLFYTESQSDSSWKGPLESNPHCQSRFTYSSLHKTASRCVLNDYRDKRLHNLSRQPGPGLHHPQRSSSLHLDGTSYIQICACYLILSLGTTGWPHPSATHPLIFISIEEKIPSVFTSLG